MKQLLALLLITIFPQSIGQSVGQPIGIPIQNASFEQLPAPLVRNIGCGLFGQLYYYPRIPGWTFSIAGGGGGGIFQPNHSCHHPAPPDSLTVAFAGNATISQDLGAASDIQNAGRNASVNRDGVYVMTFFAANYFVGYPGYYEAKISIGPHELCSADGWATANFTKITLVCPVPNYIVYNAWPAPEATPGVPASPNDHLIISLSAKGWELLFDDVSLNFTPVSW